MSEREKAKTPKNRGNYQYHTHPSDEDVSQVSKGSCHSLLRQYVGFTVTDPVSIRFLKYDLSWMPLVIVFDVFTDDDYFLLLYHLMYLLDYAWVS